MSDIGAPKCPICNSDMEKRIGKYGYFWGCKNFKTNKKCKGTVDIPKKSFIFEHIDYNKFIENNPTKYLLEIIEREPFPNHVKNLKYVLNGCNITKGTILKKDVEGKISSIFDYLRKKSMYFEMSKLAYWFYTLEGDLQGKIDYWLNNKPENEFRTEEYIKKALIDYWQETPLGFYMFYAEEFPIGQWVGEFGGYIIDLVAKDIFTDELIFIEVKGFKQKAVTAMNQLVTYLRYYNSLGKTPLNKCYIVSRGYPRGVFDNDLPFKIGLIGYVVENNKISFIPWKMLF